MPRQLIPALLLVLLGSSSSSGQDWARKMFSESSHDFGTVARGAKVEYRFQFNNPYQETAHVAGVRSSCGCTEPTVTKSELKTYEKGEVVASFNTRSFTGNHSATITVTLDKPFYAEVQLNVWGDIRSDLQVQPELVELGTIDQGQEVDRKLTVTHSGLTDWKILDVRSVNSNYEVEVKNGPKSLGQVSYDLLVHLKKDAPPGYLKDQLILVTNDARVTQFPIEVEGLVKAELTASPQSLVLGMVQPGKTASKTIVVQDSRRPFKVTAVHCDDDAFSFKTDDAAKAAKSVQVIPVMFTAPDKPGKIIKKIRIETDLGKTFVVDVTAQAEVKETGRPAEATTANSPAAADKTADDKIDAAKTDSGKPIDKAASEKGTVEKANADKPATDATKNDASKLAPAANGLNSDAPASRSSARLFRNPFRAR